MRTGGDGNLRRRPATLIFALWRKLLSHYGTRFRRKNFVPPLKGTVTVLTPLLTTGVLPEPPQLLPSVPALSSTRFVEAPCQLRTNWLSFTATNSLGTSVEGNATLVLMETWSFT